MRQEDITLQTLTNNEAVHVGYSDNDIVIVDSIQQFAVVNEAHVSMCAVAICTNGRVQAKMNGMTIELRQNQVAVIPANVVVTDLMVSPDFNIKAMFFSNQILQSFLHEKMSIWNELMYIQRHHVLSLETDDIRFYTHFYDMLCLCLEKDESTPLRSDVIQSLVRSAMLALCGAMKQQLKLKAHQLSAIQATNRHFYRFLDLLHSTEVRHRGVEWYANELCVSPKYLSVICKKHSRKTASEWITEHVLEDIRYYLRQTDLTMAQITDRLGFANPSFFGKYVKEHFGVTPVEFRKSEG
jgi:AraC-like DNA-binding protein